MQGVEEHGCGSADDNCFRRRLVPLRAALWQRASTSHALVCAPWAIVTQEGEIVEACGIKIHTCIASNRAL